MSVNSSDKYTLIIGNKNISSWSLRGYLAIKHAGIEFDEIIISLRPELNREKLDALTPAGKVPAVKCGENYVWDSLAICEYFNDLCPEISYWPNDLEMRAHARCVAAEMHSGFVALRSTMPMGIHSTFDTPEIEGALKSDIDRVKNIWSDCLTKYADGGPYLFGTYSVADMMYAPVVFRFLSYGVELDPIHEAYCEAIKNHPHVKEWMDDSDPNDQA